MRKAVSRGVATEVDIGELKAEIRAVRAELRALEWLTGCTLAVVLAMAARLFGVV